MSTLQKYKPDILQIASKHGAQKIRVFGSFSTNTDTTASDLDLLIMLEKGKDLLDLIAFKNACLAYRSALSLSFPIDNFS